jgi:hypothetical protein
MQLSARQKCLLIFLFSAVFLTVQFHSCSELAGTPSALHICPVCSTAGSAVATKTPYFAFVPVTNRLEVAPVVLSVSFGVPLATSPRAPPAL